MPPLDPQTAAEVGLPIVVSLVFLAVSVPVIIAVLKRGLHEITHGTGNGDGGPSLQRLDSRMEMIEQQQQTQSTQIAAVRADLRGLADAWEQCRQTPGCPQRSEGD